MIEAARIFAGADGALLLSWRRDDRAIVIDATPNAFPSLELGVPRPDTSHSDGVVLLGVLPSVSDTLTKWLSRNISATALLGAVDDRGQSPGKALLLVWCDASAVDPERLRALRPLVDALQGVALARSEAQFAEARLDALMGAARQGIVFVNDESHDAKVNAASSRMLGLPEGEVDAATLLDAVRALHQGLSDAMPVAAEFARVLTQPDESIRDWIWEFANAGLTTWRVSSFPVHNVSGRGRLWMFDDITAERALRRELEQQHEREQRRERQQLEALTRLLAGIAHDFSNLLTVIGGSAEMLLAVRQEAPHETAQDRDSESDLHAIRHATQRANALIRQLLSFAGRKFATPALLELDPMLHRHAAGLSAALDDAQTLQLFAGAPGARVLIDERQLALALLSFVANARETMPGAAAVIVRSARVHAPASADAQSGAGATRYVAVTVGVTDVRQPPAIADDLRVPFSSASAFGTRGEFGLGIVAAVAEQAGGTIRYSHAKGEATQYTLYLPEVDASPSAPRQTTPTIGVPALSDAATVPILVVDDDAGPRRVLRRLLEREGYSVLSAESATDALRQLEAREGRVAGVISDYLMPGMSGMELLTLVRARWPAMPIVLVSGFTYDDVTGGALRQLRAQFLPKPFTRDELLASIRAAASAMLAQ